jgi:hypothetical protein
MDYFDAIADQLLTKLPKSLQAGASAADKGFVAEVHDGVMAFVSAIDWREPFIIGLVASIVLLYVLVIVTRQHTELQMFLLTLVCGIAYAAPVVTPMLTPYWRQISSQNYFDRHGYFGMMMVSLPLTLLALVQMVRCLMPVQCSYWGLAWAEHISVPMRLPRGLMHGSCRSCMLLARRRRFL